MKLQIDKVVANTIAQKIDNPADFYRFRQVCHVTSQVPDFWKVNLRSESTHGWSIILPEPSELPDPEPFSPSFFHKMYSNKKEFNQLVGCRGHLDPENNECTVTILQDYIPIQTLNKITLVGGRFEVKFAKPIELKNDCVFDIIIWSIKTTGKLYFQLVLDNWSFFFYNY